jgi:hypothetical protein
VRGRVGGGKWYVLNHAADDGIVEKLDRDPVNALNSLEENVCLKLISLRDAWRSGGSKWGSNLLLIFFLLKLEGQLNENLLQLLIAVVNAELLKAVGLGIGWASIVETRNLGWEESWG